MYEKIISRHNPTLKFFKGLNQVKRRKKYNKITLEGYRMIDDAIANSVDISVVIFNEKVIDSYNSKKTIDLLCSATKVLVATESCFKYISSTVNSQGIVAIAKKPEKEVASGRSDKVLIINRIQDPGNLGTLIRTADAFGIHKILITKGSCDVFNPKTLRSTMSSVFNLSVIGDLDSQECFSFLNKNDIPVITTTLNNPNCRLTDLSKLPKWAIVLGNEGAGVDMFWYDNSEYRLKIPMLGKAESLNVAVAGGIIMYQLSCFSNSNMI